MAVISGGHLLHVGYPKTGSKFLQSWFAQHPDILFSEWGIAGFGDAHAMMAAAGSSSLAPWQVTSHEALLAPLLEYRDLGARPRAIALPTRSGQLSACAMLAKLFPGSHILIVTRGYEALLRSFYAELVIGGISCGFEEFCDALLAQIAAGQDVFDFDAVIRDYATAFGEERLIVLPYELLRDSPTAFLGAIETSLAIRSIQFPTDPVRRSPPPARLGAYRQLTRWARAVPLPFSLRQRFHHCYIAALRSGGLDRFAVLTEWLSGLSGEHTLELPPALVDALRGRATILGERPLYRDYAGEYLL